jgi:hypothetical protein
MRRREFIAALGSAAVLTPAIARAQQMMRRIGVLENAVEGDRDTRVAMHRSRFVGPPATLPASIPTRLS